MPNWLELLISVKMALIISVAIKVIFYIVKSERADIGNAK